jgi:DNA-directed RNA polymerase specialized sigma24 family protein
MTSGPQQILAVHLRRHARMLRNVACGLGKRGDADDLIQTLYTRWWQRMQREPGWSPPEHAAALFVCVKRVVLDSVDKEWRHARRAEASHSERRPLLQSPEDRLHALERLDWILSHMPATLAEALQASLAAGRDGDAMVASQLGITHAAYTARLFKARRAAEGLAHMFEQLEPRDAELLAELKFGGKSRAQLAHEHGLLRDDLDRAVERALARLQPLAADPKRTA